MRRLHNSYVSVIIVSHGNHYEIVIFRLEQSTIPTMLSNIIYSRMIIKLVIGPVMNHTDHEGFEWCR